jgi:hypothetical protein
MKFLTDPRAPHSHAILFSRRNTNGRCLATRSPAPHRINPLECALTSKHRVLPGFGRNCRHSSLLECGLAKTPPASPLECALTKKWGRGRGASIATANHLSTIFRIFLPSSVCSKSFAYTFLRKLPGCTSISSPSGTSRQASRHAITILYSRNTGHGPLITTPEVSSAGPLPEFRISSFVPVSALLSRITAHLALRVL